MKRNITDVSPYFELKDAKKERREKKDRFGGLSEDEVLQRKLPDHLGKDLDILFVGINPGLMSAFKGHHYSGHNNHFWPCLYESGLVPVRLTYQEDFKCLDHKIGLTNIVERTTRAASDLSKKEVKDGIAEMIRKIKETNPVVICFNGKGIYETFSKKKCKVGLQPEKIPGTNSLIYVMPSTSGRTMSYPRKEDKLVFFKELKELLDRSHRSKEDGET